MKKAILLLFTGLLLMSCSNNDDSDSNDDMQQEEVGEAEANFTVQGSKVGTIDFVADDFGGLPIGERLIIELEQTDDFAIDIQLLEEGGFEVGTVKNLTVSSDMLTNEVRFIVLTFNDNNNQFFESTGGTVTITGNVPFELEGGNGNGIFLSGDVNFTAEDDNGEVVNATGSFKNVRIVLNG